MKKTWNISDSEWLVLRCLWKKSPLRLKEITEMLKEETGWSSNMVRAMIVRLQEKQAIGTPDEAVAAEFRDAALDAPVESRQRIEFAPIDEASARQAEEKDDDYDELL